MASKSERTRCITCDKEKRAVRCEGCYQLFCYEHFTDHRQALSRQLDQIEASRDLFRQKFNEQASHPQTSSSSHSQVHLLMRQVDQWEEESIKTIQQTASECRQLLIQNTSRSAPQTETNLAKLTEEIRQTRKENDFNEIDLKKFDEQLKQLSIDIDKSSHMAVQQSSTSLIKKLSVVISARKLLSTINISNSTKWKQYAVTVAGGNGEGNQLNQLSRPYGIYIDDEDQSIYIADQWSHRIVKWKSGASHGQVVAGGNGEGSRLDQLNHPTDLIVDKNSDSLIICDWGNRRVVRWPRRSEADQHIVISNIDCFRIAIDSTGDLYVADWKKNEVRRWKEGDSVGTVVAGGNGKGNNANQLNGPTSIYVDEEHSLYVSDHHNNRIMKWMKGAKEGISVAGAYGQGNSLTQLSYPQGITVDHLHNIYVADSGNDRIMRWSKGSRTGSVIVRGHGQGEKPNQFNCLGSVTFDRKGNLYVVDSWNHRVQKFDVDSN
ncbi:unnamed protein product [Adineta steineri]|uniref:Uncharacterized protein n=1 Tax=Adineta steineri TaxID=433720 RepID=A0A819QI52_9BILA|nr:unnamed protein product [Adineta steineri]CAF4025697.1 unnamed protein product [Adineta steineri]